MSRTTGAGLAVLVLALLAYVTTLCPTIFAGDSGELATAATRLGIAHPPGYPLWTVLGRTAVVLGPGEPAASLNLLSAGATAGAAALVFLILHLLTGRLVVSAGVALAFALSRAVWSQAVITEVYALNLLLTAAALAAALAARRGRPRLWLLAAYLLGLGAGNHPFVLLAAPPVALLALVPGARSPEPLGPRLRRIPAMAALFVLGLTIYLYLPVRLGAGPDPNWAELRSLADVRDHVLRVQYGGLGEAGAHTSLALRLRVFFQVLGESVPLAGFLAAAGGVIALFRAGHAKRAGLLIVFFALCGPVTAGAIRYEDTFLDRSVVTPFFLPAVLATFLLAGTGVAALDAFLHRRLEGKGRVASIATVLLALVPAGALHAMNGPACDRSESTLARAYSETVLDELPPDSRLFTHGDTSTFPLFYFHEVMGLRPDVTLYDRTLNLNLLEYGEDLVELSRTDRKARALEREVEIAFGDRFRPIFYAELVELPGHGNCRLVANGLVYQLLRPGEAPAEIVHEALRLPPTSTGDYLESHLAGAALYREGTYLTRVGRTEDARAAFSEARARAPNIAAVQRNVGLGFLDLGDLAEAENCYLAAVDLEPDNENALYNLAILYATTDRVEPSLHVFERLLATGSEYPEVFLNYGIQLVRAGNLPAAERMANRALALLPELAPANRLLEAVRLGLELGGEEGVLEARSRVEPLTAGGTLQLARRYLERGDLAKATELYRSVAQQAPESSEAQYGLGYGLLQVGELEEAAAAFRAVLRHDPESARARNALAYIFALRGDSLAVAERLAEEALELDPSRAAYWYDTLGWVRYRRQRWDDALEALQRAESGLPLDDLSSRAETDFHIGAVLMAQGRRREAEAYLKRSSDRATDEMWLPDLRAHLRELGLPEDRT